MDKREAMLRELNLFPLWRERVAVAAKTADSAETPEAAANVAEAAPLVESVVPPEISEPIAAPAAVQILVATPATTDVVASPLDSMDWAALKTTVRDCTACSLRAGCTQTIFGVGDEQADWLFVGEGPGADEDARG